MTVLLRGSVGKKGSKFHLHEVVNNPNVTFERLLLDFLYSIFIILRPFNEIFFYILNEIIEMLYGMYI